MTRNWKSIPKQTCLVENGVIGDCWRCCIAAVLGLPAEQVPHFMRKDDGTRNFNDEPDTQRWLNDRGYQLVGVRSIGGREVVRYPCYHEDADQFPTPVVISVGPTNRSKGRGSNHAVVAQSDKVLYDPHPSEAGLTAVIEQFLIIKI